MGIRPSDGVRPSGRAGAWEVLLEGRAEAVGDAATLAAWLEERGAVALGGLDGWHSGVAIRHPGGAGGAAELHLFTGFLGLEPCFWVPWRDGFAFAPSLALLRRLVPGELDLDACADVVVLGHAMGADTLEAGIRTLPPGQRLVHDGVSMRFVPAPRSTSPCRPEEVGAWLREVWPRLVARSFQRPGRVGALLSGGLDSRAVALASPPGVPTFTFGRPGTLDVVLAAEVARQLGRPHTVVPIAPDAISTHAAGLIARLSGMVNPCHAPGADTAEAVAMQVDHLASGSFGDALMGSTAKRLPADASGLDCLRATVSSLDPRYRDQLVAQPILASVEARLQARVEPELDALDPPRRAARYLFAHRVRRFTAAGVADRRARTETVHPFYAAELFAAMEGAPLAEWQSGALYCGLLRSLHPAAMVPWARTGLPFDAPAEAVAKVVASRRRERAWDRLLRNLGFGGRWDPRSFHDVGWLLRNDPHNRAFLVEVLAPARLAPFPFLHADGVAAVLNDHLRGRRDNSTLLGRLVALSLWAEIRAQA